MPLLSRVYKIQMSFKPASVDRLGMNTIKNKRELKTTFQELRESLQKASS